MTTKVHNCITAKDVLLVYVYLERENLRWEGFQLPCDQMCFDNISTNQTYSIHLKPLD